MKVILLTSSRHGSASYHFQEIMKIPDMDIVMVVLSRGFIKNKRNYYKQKFKKILRIGLLGTINGIRMRRWFGSDIQKYGDIENIDELCRKQNIPFYITESINCKETEDLFLRAKADVGLSLGNGYIGSKIFSIPIYGMLNIHHEILPAYQNAQSIIWQLFNGSAETGYTIHKIDKKIDTGEILYQESMPIEFKGTLHDTVSYTFHRLLNNSANGLKVVLENFDYYYKNAKHQGKGNSYTTPSILQYWKIYRNYKKLRKRQK